jgi:HK97 family phage portal protein
MGIGAWFRGAFSREKEAQPSPGALMAKILANSSSPRKGRAELLLAYALSPWLRSIVGRISRDTASMFRPTLFNAPEEDPNRKQIYQHPVLDLLRRPHTTMPRRTVYTAIQAPLELVGEGFLVIDRNQAGFPAELSPVPPTWIADIATRSFPFFRLSTNGIQRLIDERDVVWIRDPDPANPYSRGVGIGQACADELDSDEGAAKVIKSFFENGGMPSWLVALEGAGDAEVAAFDEFLKGKYSGSRRANQPHITNKPIKAEKLNVSFTDMQLAELRKFERDIVIQAFGIPPELIGVIENSNRATSEGAYYRYARSVIVPRLDLLVDELQSKLIPQFGENLYLGYENPIPEDREFFIRAVATAPAAFRAGEVRRRVGMLPDNEIDNDRLGTKPVVAGPTNVPPGKAGDPPWVEDLPALRLRAAIDLEPH